MDIGNLVNENVSKKMGIGMLAMYLASQCTDFNLACVIAGIGIFGIAAQTVIDWYKLCKGDTR
jgi:hypothetical protein